MDNGLRASLAREVIKRRQAAADIRNAKDATMGTVQYFGGGVDRVGARGGGRGVRGSRGGARRHFVMRWFRLKVSS